MRRWRDAKLFYIGLLVEHSQPELAETFFNSVVTRILLRSYYDNDLVFVRAALSTEYIEPEPPIYRSYYPMAEGERSALTQLFRGFGWSRPFADLERDLDDLLGALEERPGGAWAYLEPNYQIQVLNSALYRNKAAYVFGKIVNGNEELPFVVPVLHEPDGLLELDTIVLEPQQIDSRLLALPRLFHGRHGGAVGLCGVPAFDDAGAGAFRALHHARARQTGKDPLLPRAAAPPAPFARRVRRWPPASAAR